MISRIAKARDLKADDGVSLILALIFVTITAFVVSSMLTLADATFSFSATAGVERGDVYAADGAIEGAITNLRYNLDAGIPGTGVGCNFTAPAGTNVSTTVPVTCTAQTDSGPGAFAQLKNAILTLGSGNSNEGLIVQNGGSVNLGIEGAIYSHSVISVNSGEVDVSNGNATSMDGTAADNCSGNKLVVASPGVKHCGSTITDPNGADPGYQPVLTSAPGLAATPRCLSSGVVKFFAGEYVLPPTNPFASIPGSACASSQTWWLSPYDNNAGATTNNGAYYFLFPDATATWTASGINIIGGTPSASWDPTATQTLPASGPYCDKSSSNGIQLVFGGNSRMYFGNDNGTFEICASASTNSPPIAIYGVSSNTTGGYTAPTAGGCMLTVPFPQSGSDATHCSLIDMDHNSNKPNLLVHGAVYTPADPLFIRVHNLNSTSVFDGGIICRDLVASVSSSWTGITLFALPGTGRGARHVVLTAKLNGNSVLTSDVTINDDVTGGIPGKTVTLNTWSATP